MYSANNSQSDTYTTPQPLLYAHTASDLNSSRINQDAMLRQNANSPLLPLDRVQTSVRPKNINKTKRSQNGQNRMPATVPATMPATVPARSQPMGTIQGQGRGAEFVPLGPDAATSLDILHAPSELARTHLPQYQSQYSYPRPPSYPQHSQMPYHVDHRPLPSLPITPIAPIAPSHLMSPRVNFLIKNKHVPLSSLTNEEIDYVQRYLNMIKNRRRRAHPHPLPRYLQQQQVESFDVRNPTCSRMSKKTQKQDMQERIYDLKYGSGISTGMGAGAGAGADEGIFSSEDFGNLAAYNNPYEYDSRQDVLPPQYIQPYLGEYDIDPKSYSDLGLDAELIQDQFPTHIRNVNIESSLMQREATHIPGQRELTETEMNRFSLLPFDPQDTKHIVWEDNMPRGGYSTRADRLEL